ncbi:unnamed protein product [Prunus armeniaca]
MHIFWKKKSVVRTHPPIVHMIRKSSSILTFNMRIHPITRPSSPGGCKDRKILQIQLKLASAGFAPLVSRLTRLLTTQDERAVVSSIPTKD